jgi:predicted Zn-dependent protease
MKIRTNAFHLTRWLTKPQWVFSLISPLVALAIWITSSALPANASLFDLILGGVQVVQLSNVSDKQEIALGSQMNQQILQSEFHLLNDPVIAKYVDQVGQRLVPYSERPNIPYHFQVVQDKQVNAFATMGGYVYVTSGLLATADNEAQLASVLGHEMGHIASKHVLKQMRQQAIESGIASAAGVGRNVAVNLGIQLAMDLPGSRKHEFEADKLGLFTFTKEGYDPAAMPTFMQKLVKSGSTPAFLSTHPATPERIRVLDQMIAQNNLTSGSLGMGHTDYQATIKSRLHS